MLRASIARRATLRTLIAGALALAAVHAALGPTPVLAHAELVDASPPPSGTVLEAPEALELQFTEAIDPDLAFIDLLDTAQRRVDGVGAPRVVADGRMVRVALPELAPGVYTVAYQVVSTVDGHATSGAFAFVVDPTGAEAPPASPPDASTPAVDGWAIGARWAGLSGALVALGSLATWWRSRRLLPAASRPPWSLVALAAAAAYAGLAAYLWLSARPIVEAVPERASGLPLDFAAPFGSTAFAVAMRVALGASLVTAAIAGVAALAGRRLGDRLPLLAATLAAMAALAGMSMAAHAAAAGGIGFGLIDWAHLVGVAAWLGALPAIFILARRAETPSAGALLRSHGAVALVAAPLVALTGIANSPLVLGTARGLVASEYGNLLLAKAGLLCVALAIGAVNHLALRGHGRARVAVLVGAELAIAAVAVGMAATLVTLQPVAARQPAVVSTPVTPAHLFGQAGPTSIHATVDLPTPGRQRYLVTVADARSGAPRDDVQLVFLELGPPDGSGLPGERVDLEPNADRPGLYGAEGAHLSVEGDWTVDVVVRRSGALDDRASFVVPVQSRTPPQRVLPPDTGIGVPGPLAALWGVLPDGPAGWLPAALALVALLLTGRMRRGAVVAGLRIGLVAVIGLGALGTGSRAVVALANAPAPGDLAEHVPPARFRASTEIGEAVYRANCAACHGVDGDGSGPVRTLPAAGALANAVTRMSSAELSYRIANGLAGTPMPAFAAALTEEERWHLVRYLEERWNGN